MRSNWIFLREEVWNRVYLSLKLGTRDEPYRLNGSFVSRIGKPWNNALAVYEAVPLFRKWLPETVYGGIHYFWTGVCQSEFSYKKEPWLKTLNLVPSCVPGLFLYRKHAVRIRSLFFIVSCDIVILNKWQPPVWVSHFHIRWKDSACLVCLQGLGGDMIMWVVVLRSCRRKTTAQESVLTTSGSKHRTRLFCCLTWFHFSDCLGKEWHHPILFLLMVTCE